jgi:hypothetical protein
MSHNDDAQEAEDSLRLARAQEVVRQTRGIYRGLTGQQSLVDELIAERRKEARRENLAG